MIAIALCAALAATTGGVGEVGVVDRLGATLPADLTFTDQDGRAAPLAAVFDGRRPVLLVLAYFRCATLCDATLGAVARGLAALDWAPEETYRVVTVSFDPRDRPAEAARKRRAFVGAVGRAVPPDAWPFLTGDEAAVRRLADAVGFRYTRDAATGQYAHAAVLFVLTPDRKLARALSGVDLAPRDLRLALLEAGGGRIGGVLDRVLLTCFRWDPASRRYAPFVLGFVRLGGLAILVGVGTALVVLWGRERRRRRRP